MSTTIEPKGFRRDIMVLHAVSDLMEKHPDLPRPNVEFARRYSVEERAHVGWHLSVSYGDGPQWVYGEQTYEEYEASRKVWQRINLEERIAAIVEALGPDVEWEKNDPTKEEYYYRLSTAWHGARLTITTSREAARRTDGAVPGDAGRGRHQVDRPGAVPMPGSTATNRQCSIGYHGECSDRSGETCQCLCHDDAIRNWSVEGHVEGGVFTVTRAEQGQHRWPPVKGEPATMWAHWIMATSEQDARLRAMNKEAARLGLDPILPEHVKSTLGIALTRDQLELWAGRALSDEEVEALDMAIPQSSVPEAVGTVIVDSWG